MNTVRRMPPRSVVKRVPVPPKKFDASPAQVSRDSKIKASAAAVAEAEKLNVAADEEAAKIEAARVKTAAKQKHKPIPTNLVGDDNESSDDMATPDLVSKKSKTAQSPDAVLIADIIAKAVAAAFSKNTPTTPEVAVQTTPPDQFTPYVAEDLMSIITAQMASLPAEAGASSRSPFITHGVRFVNSIAPAVQLLAENQCANACFFLTSNQSMNDLALKVSRGKQLSASEGAHMLVLLEDERENIAQMIQATMDIQSGIISLCRTLLANQATALLANNAYKLDAQPFTFPASAATLATGPLSRKAAIAREAAAQQALALASSTSDPVKMNPTIAYKYTIGTKGDEPASTAVVKTPAQLKKESGAEARADILKVLCYNCGVNGHYATQCRAKPRRRSRSREASRSRSRSRERGRARSRSRSLPAETRSSKTSSSGSAKGKGKSSKKD